MNKAAVCIAKEGSITHDGSILSFLEFKEAIDLCPNLVIMDDELWLVKDIRNKSISNIIYDIQHSRSPGKEV